LAKYCTSQSIFDLNEKDFDGQRKAEKIFQTVILVFAGIGLAWGYSLERFSITVFTLTAGFVLAGLVSFVELFGNEITN